MKRVLIAVALIAFLMGLVSPAIGTAKAPTKAAKTSSAGLVIKAQARIEHASLWERILKWFGIGPRIDDPIRPTTPDQPQTSATGDGHVRDHIIVRDNDWNEKLK